MKLDDIQDIEVLRKVLKATMCKCIEETIIEDYGGRKLEANKDEWYFYEYDRDCSKAYTIYDGKGNCGYIDEDDFKKIFFTEDNIQEDDIWKIF